MQGSRLGSSVKLRRSITECLLMFGCGKLDRNAGRIADGTIKLIGMLALNAADFNLQQRHPAGSALD